MKSALRWIAALCLAGLSAVGAGCASDLGGTDPGVGDGRMGRGRGGRRSMGAQAQRPGESSVIQYDANQDGKVTREEFHAARRLLFLQHDQNGDGVLGPSEVRRPAPAADADAFARLDADGDGVITRAEWDADGGRLFERLDTNADTVLSRDELSSLRGDRPGGRQRP